MINSALERQMKNIDEQLCRLIEEWDDKKLDATSACNTRFLQIIKFCRISSALCCILNK
jgi:hypothetical protein